MKQSWSDEKWDQKKDAMEELLVVPDHHTNPFLHLQSNKNINQSITNYRKKNVLSKKDRIFRRIFSCWWELCSEHTLDGGAEEAVADVGPAEVDAEDDEGVGQDTSGGGGDGGFEGVAVRVDDAEPGDGEAKEEGEGAA